MPTRKGEASAVLSDFVIDMVTTFRVAEGDWTTNEADWQPYT
jgi:hypothetical protein